MDRSDAGLDDDQKLAARTERHNIWLSKLPESITLCGGSEKQTYLARLTRDAIMECMKTRGAPETFLLDSDYVKTLQGECGSFEDTAVDFKQRVADSIPKSVLYRMKPADESALALVAQSVSFLSPTSEDDAKARITEVASNLANGLGKDPSFFRTITVAYVILSECSVKAEGALAWLAAEETWPEAKSLDLHKTALNNIQRNAGLQCD